ncbi:hypothetical protein V1477_014507 [Vespula maculifrons]|uniref:Uncharacterized protein n=2 Tax=Vespula TaxID=7451 RepID=A0A834MYL6_VESVU|nr:hypothetical protein HZH66_010482 [Vespula vulgaris]
MRTTETAVARSGGWATVLLTGTLNNATTLGYLRHGSGVARWKSDYGGGGKNLDDSIDGTRQAYRLFINNQLQGKFYERYNVMI